MVTLGSDAGMTIETLNDFLASEIHGPSTRVSNMSVTGIDKVLKFHLCFIDKLFFEQVLSEF
jgi:hypothetical protein